MFLFLAQSMPTKRVHYSWPMSPVYLYVCPCIHLFLSFNLFSTKAVRRPVESQYLISNQFFIFLQPKNQLSAIKTGSRATPKPYRSRTKKFLHQGLGAGLSRPEPYTDIYTDVMSWLYGGSIAHGKANRFLEGSQFEPTLNRQQK